jgi:hypothetical protein
MIFTVNRDIDKLSFVMEKCCFLYEVRTEILYGLRLQRVNELALSRRQTFAEIAFGPVSDPGR